ENGGHRPWANGFDHTYGRGAPGRWATFHVVDSVAKADGKILLFARGGARFDNLMDRLYPCNGDRSDVPVLVVRDRGAANGDLARRFPERIPYLLVDKGRDLQAE